MAERTFYVVCKDDCLTEGMSKEQILTAIEQSLEQGYVSDPGKAVFSKIKEIRANGTAQIWIGTEAQFNAISPAPTIGKSVVRIGENGVMYICSDDSTLNDLSNHLNDNNNPHGVTFKQVAGADILPVSKGGTGATNAAVARSNLGVTPENIGALPTSGGNMTGGINFGQATRGLGWTTADGTQFSVRPYAEGNLFQITRTPPGGAEVNALSIDKDGNILFGADQAPLPVESGGTGNTNGRAESAASADTAAKLATARTIQTNLGSTSGVSFDGSANVSPGVTGVLPVGNGGTGAADAAGACANIGAFPASGGSMIGNIDFGNEMRGLQWTTENGTEWQVRPYTAGNIFQIVRHTTDGNYYGDITIDSNGNVTLSQALPISSGGTGTNDTLQAAINFGFTPHNVADFSAESAGDWEGQVKAYILENVTTRRPFVFNAGWSGHDYGSGIAWNTSGAETFVIIQNMSGTGSVKFWRYCNGSWSNIILSNESRGFFYSATEPAYVDNGIWFKPVE